MKQHYTITIPETEYNDTYTDGIMAESLEDAVIKFSECLDLCENMTTEQITNLVTAI